MSNEEIITPYAGGQLRTTGEDFTYTPPAPARPMPEPIKAPVVRETSGVRTQSQKDVQRIEEITKQMQEAQTQLAEIRKSAEQMRAKKRPPKEESPITDEEAEVIGVEKEEESPEIIQLKESSKAIDTEVENYTNLLDTQIGRIDDLAQQTVTSIKASFERRRVQQQEINRRELVAYQTLGIRMGARHFPTIQAGVLSAVETQGLQRLADLDVQEMSLISEAQAANEEKKFELLHAKLEAIENARKEKREILMDINRMTLEQEKNIRERMKAIREQAEFEMTLLQPEAAISPTNDYRNWALAGGEEGTGKTFGEWLERSKQTQLPTSYREWELAGGEQGTGMDFADWLTRKEGQAAMGYTQLDIDNAAMSILDRAANIWNFPKEVRTQINNRMREVRDQGYAPQWMLQRASDKQLKEISDFDTTIASWDNVRMLAERLKDRFGPTVISAYDGSTTAFIRQYSKDPEFAVLYAEIEKAFQLYRKATTGAQASDKELKVLRPLLPQLTERPEIFFGKIDETVKGTKRAKRIYLETLEAGAYYVEPFREGEETEPEENVIERGGATWKENPDGTYTRIK